MSTIFFERYDALCKSHGETPNSVARIVGASSGSVTAWKNGAEPRYGTIQKIAKYFGVSPEYLKGIDDSDNFATGYLYLSDSDQEELHEIYADGLQITNKSEANVASKAKPIRGFFSRLQAKTLHVVRESDLRNVASQIGGVEARVESLIENIKSRTLSINEQKNLSFIAKYRYSNEMKFALFGGSEDIDDDDIDDVIRYAEFVRERKNQK